MSIIIVGGVVAIGVVGLAAYQLFKAKKAVTVASVASTVKSDVAAVKADVKKI